SKTDDTNIQIIQQYQKSEKVKNESDEKALGQAPASSAAPPEEKVDLSTTARDIQKLKNEISRLPDVRNEKVQDLKKQLDQGTYKVDGGKIAEKMVGESLLDIFA
ncbi:MAG: flagellar biosynthesis anti-sigma factor FlgM, partial [Syntrophales bacterium]